MATNQAFIPNAEVQASLRAYHKFIASPSSKIYSLREKMRQTDLAYLREQDLTEVHWIAMMQNRKGDTNAFQNITVPVVKPQVTSAVDYQIAVFLSRYPIIDVVAPPEHMDAAMQMRDILINNSQRFNWLAEFVDFFFDSFKYWGAVETTWDKVVTPIIETEIRDGSSTAKPVDVIHQGNRVTRWDPYNTYFDDKVRFREIASKGEFAGHTMLMSRSGLKNFIQSLDLKINANLKEAFKSSTAIQGTGTSAGYAFQFPKLNYSSLVDTGAHKNENWDSWFQGSNSRFKERGGLDVYEVSIEYARIIPADHGLSVPARNTPQIWKMIWVNHEHLIYCERQTNAHELIPVLFFDPSDEGLGYQSKSLAEDGAPFQSVASALMNGVVQGRRRAVSDRLLYDPSRIAEHHIKNASPTARIPVRPGAYGKGLADALYQIPYKDDQAGLALQEIGQVIGLADKLNQQNPVRQGQFIKGNKTDGQWDDSMQHAQSRDLRTSLLLEAVVFTPLKQILKFDILQYQGAESIFLAEQETVTQVDPLALRKAVLGFKLTDGQHPANKVISKDTLKTALQAMATSPQLGAAYNLAPLFSYLVKTEHADLKPFEKSPAQLEYEKAVSSWQQVAMEAAKHGKEITAPMPKPQDYGYAPT